MTSGAQVVNPPVPLEAALIKAWIFSQNPDGTFSPATFGGGGGSSNVNLTGINGNTPGVTHPLYVELSDGTNPFGVVGNPLSISAASLPLPSNAAQETGGNLATLAGTVSAGKVAISAASLPLPANAAIETGGNLATIAGAISTAKMQENLAQVAGSTVAVSATGVQKVGVVGNAGAIFDGATAAAVPANALLQGARANVGTTLPTAVTDGQMVAPMADKFGRQVTTPNGHRSMLGTAVLNSSSASLVDFIPVGGSNVFRDLLSFIATNESSTATIVSLSDGTVVYKYALAANGGIVISWPTPKPATSSNTKWQVSNSAAVAVDYEAEFVNNQ